MYNSTTSHGVHHAYTLSIYIVDGLLFTISLIGTIANVVAMFILSSSIKIRTSKSYVLLMNQSLSDIIVTVFMMIYIPLKYTLSWSSMSGIYGQLVCHVIYNQLYIVVATAASSYNLIALSLERLVSVLWPVFHRVQLTYNRMLGVTVAVWTIALVLMSALSIPTNGITSSGRCHYWNKFSLQIHSKVHTVFFNVAFILAPLTIMIGAYVTIYVRLATRNLNENIKTNVVKMLSICVALFFICHILRAVLSILNQFSETNWYQEPLYVFGIIMVQLNCIVNPIIYSLQYMDYKKELKRQYYKLILRKSQAYESETSSVPVNS